MGQPKTLREIDQAGVRFVVPLRASAGFRERFLAEVGHARRCARCATCPSAKPKLPAEQRTRFKGALRDWEIPASDDAPAAEAAGRVHPLLRGGHSGRRRARARAGQGRGRAGADAQRTRRPLLQDPSQVERRIGQILGVNITGLIDVTVTTRDGKLTLDLAAQPGRDRHGRVVRRDLRARDEPPRPDHRRAGPAALQRPADRRAPPPRPQTDAEGPPDLPAQRRPRLRADQHRRDLAADLRTDRSPDPRRARRRPATPRTAARRPRRQTHRPQHPRRLPRPRPHLHPHRHPTRPAHRHPTTHPRPTQNPAALANTGRPCPHELRKMGLAGAVTVATRASCT